VPLLFVIAKEVILGFVK